MSDAYGRGTFKRPYAARIAQRSNEVLSAVRPEVERRSNGWHPGGARRVTSRRLHAYRSLGPGLPLSSQVGNLQPPTCANQRNHWV